MASQLPTDAEIFSNFLAQQISGDGKDKSPEEILDLWRLEQSEVIDDIRQGIVDLEAGNYKSIYEVDAELRKKHNMPKD